MVNKSKPLPLFWRVGNGDVEAPSDLSKPFSKWIAERVCTGPLLALSPASRLLALAVLHEQQRAISYANQVITYINTHRLAPRLLARDSPVQARSWRTVLTNSAGLCAQPRWEKKLLSSKSCPPLGLCKELSKFSSLVLSELKLSRHVDMTCAMLSLWER